MSENNLQDFIKKNNEKKVKLHLGCGGVQWKNFINIDLHPTNPDKKDSSRSGCVADVYADIKNLGLDNNSIDEIFTSHTFEHFTKWEGGDMLRDWHRMLKDGAKCVIETPDFWRCIIWLFHPNKKKRELGRNQIYGNQWDRIDYETHRYLWTPKEVKELSNKIGFAHISISHNTQTHYQFRDMKITLTK